MIKGIGIDILEKKRISLIHAKYGERFENRILGKQEKQELKFKNKLNKTRFIANNFVCKEAFSKVVGLGFSRGIALKEIEVLRDDEGKPFLSLSGKTKTITEKLGIKHLHVSISDTSKLSSAFVIGE